jgi:hypothetical protein
MAIVKTIFTGQSLAAQAPVLLAYLQLNASDYFTNITADANGNISCYVGDTLALLLGMDGTSTRKVSLANGTSVETTLTASEANTARTVLFKYAKKTSNGIMLITNNTKCLESNTGPLVIIITKDESGNTVIIGRIQTGTDGGSSITMFSANIENDATMFKPVINTNIAGLAQFSRQTDISAFTCVGCSSAHYAPKVFFTTFCQFAQTECDLSLNGKSYASDGYFALMD